MQNAHTIVEVPEHIIRVPAYQRRQTQCKVAIGTMYRPAIKITPAVEIYVRRSRVNPVALLAGVAVLAALIIV